MARDKHPISVHLILQWAFGKECAQLELPQREEPEQRGFGFGMEYVLMEQARLGCQIDTFRGQSYPHEDAEAVAAVVSHMPDSLGGIRMAITVAELSRSGIVPDWMEGAVPRLQPMEWKPKVNWREPLAKSELLEVLVSIELVPHPRDPKVKIAQRRKTEVFYTPCRWVPSRHQIDAARQAYTDWWLALDEIRQNLQAFGGLREYTITDTMPPRKPWDQCGNSGGR